MRILWNNLLVSTLTYTPSSEDANYPVENIFDVRLSRQFRTTGDTSEQIVIDAGAGNTLDMDSFSISGHNFTSAATVKIQANATDAWGAPTLDETMTYGPETMVAFFTGTDKRFWRLDIADAANPDTVIKIGRLMGTDYLQITKSTKRGMTEKINDTTQPYISGGGQYYATQGYRYRSYTFPFPYWTNTMRESIRTMLTAVQNTSPVVLVIDENNTDKIYPMYSIIGGDFSVTELQKSGYNWAGNLEFRQVF